MKHFSIVIPIFFMVSSLLFSWVGANDSIETFEIHEDYSPRVSIESWWERNGWIPVVLSFGTLQVSLPVNADDLAAAGGGETGISEMLVGDINLLFDIYEHNPVRTRMRLLDKNMPVTFKINRVEKQAAFYVGNRRLKCAPIRVTFTEIAPTTLLYELNFGGKDVYTYSRFIFDSSTGNIYSVCRSLNSLNLETSPIWAKKIDREKERFIKQRGGEIK